MTTFVNTSTSMRYWPGITDPETEHTLILDPGQEVELDLPEDFDDAWLKAAGTKNRPAQAVAPAEPKGDTTEGDQEHTE